jgi:hypothetical protein
MVVIMKQKVDGNRYDDDDDDDDVEYHDAAAAAAADDDDDDDYDYDDDDYDDKLDPGHQPPEGPAVFPLHLALLLQEPGHWVERTANMIPAFFTLEMHTGNITANGHSVGQTKSACHFETYL